MRKVNVLMLACLVVSGCAHQQPYLAPLPTPQRAKPLQAMQTPEPASVFEACRFRDFDGITLDQQGQALRSCLQSLGPAYRDLLLRHSTLVEWIEGSN